MLDSLLFPYTMPRSSAHGAGPIIVHGLLTAGKELKDINPDEVFAFCEKMAKLDREALDKAQTERERENRIRSEAEAQARKINQLSDALTTERTIKENLVKQCNALKEEVDRLAKKTKPKNASKSVLPKKRQEFKLGDTIKR